jgi:hypothetical protein
MQTSNINDVLLTTILIGMILSLAALVVAVINGRSSHKAQVKATLNLRELYDRTYRKTPFISRRFISISRPDKVERRVARSAQAPPVEAPPKEAD